MNKKYLVVPIVIILTTSLILVLFDQADQNHMNETFKELVEEAVRLIEDKGEAAFPELRQEGTQWFADDTYVFVWKTDGIRTVYPPDLNGEGENMSTLMDATGKEIGKKFIEIALGEDGEGWIDYKWPKPGETEPSNKRTYIKVVYIDEQTYLVGSGFYMATN